MPQIEHVGTIEQATALAMRLNDTGREKPVAVVSVPASRDVPYIDAERIRDEVGDVVEVVTLTTGAPSRAFSTAMAAGTQVYGGAGRVYPVGSDWVTDLRRSPLRLAFDATEGARSTQALVEDAIRMAVAAGLIGRTASTSVREVEGTVVSLVAGRGVVRTSSGSFVVVGELVVPGLPIERLLTKGMTVRGNADEANRLDIHAMLRPATALTYQPNEVVLARVDAVSESAATLLIHPQVAVAVTLADITLNDLDTLDSLMSRSEVLRARVETREPWKLRLWDVDDDEVTIPAFSLINGGPPWLVEGLPEADAVAALGVSEERMAEDDTPRSTGLTSPISLATPTIDRPTALPPASEPVTPNPSILDRRRRSTAPNITSPIPVSAETEPPPAAPLAKPAPPPLSAPVQLQTELNQSKNRVRELEARVRDLLEENREIVENRHRFREQVVRLETQLAKSRQKLRGTRTQSGMEVADEGPWFVSLIEQFRFEVMTAWVRRIPAGQKAELRLAEYEIGEAFLASVERLEGISRAKIVEVVVEVLTGLAETNVSREHHPLRESPGGTARQLVGKDGATCWRVSLQVKTPSARRLHYWRRPDGSIELARVAVHDDYSA